MDSILKSTNVLFDESLTIDRYFELTARKFENNIAIKENNVTLSYKQLNEHCNQYANFLIKKGVIENQNIGIHIERSIELAISIVAILKIGAVCVPLDPTLPKARLENIIRETNINCILHKNNIIFTDFIFSGQLIPCDLIHEFPVYEDKCDLNINHRHINDTSFIFYTSGSSGEPKGIQIPHGGILNDTHPEIAQPPLNEDDCFLITSPIGSIRLTGELFYPWFAGAELVVLPQNLHTDVPAIIELINRERITVIFVVPTMLREMLLNKAIVNCSSLRYVQSLGEKLPKHIRDDFFTRLKCDLVNVYGQTETGMCTLICIDTLSHESYVTVGKVVVNRTMYILDAELKPVPKGEIGEVYVGGHYISNGYYNDECLTNERFIKDVFAPDPKSIMYRTSDIGRINSKDQLEYLGRIDQIVKIGGMRVSLIEIEAILLSIDHVKDVVVKEFINHRGEVTLIAVIEAIKSNQISTSKWRNILQEKIPSYMIPNNFLYMDSLPKLQNGKLDQQEIIKLLESQSNEEQSNANTNYTYVEKQIKEIWRKVLLLDGQEIKKTDLFVELGGNSLSAVACMVSINEHFKTNIEESQIYNLTFGELVELLESIKERL
jgi:amino acid adenylation domain-containing protein